MRPLFSETSAVAVRLIIAATFAIATMFVDVRFDALTTVRQTIKTLLWPIESAVRIPHVVVANLSQWFVSHSRLIERLQTLALENERLRTEQLKVHTLRVENNELRRLLTVQNSSSERLLQAQIERFSNDPFIHRATLNRGMMAGVEIGHPVISADGLVGQIVETYPHASEVLLMTDSTHHLPVQVTRTRFRAIAIGVGRMDRLELRNLPDTADIVPGDFLETSGLGGRFEPGVPVAKVDEVIRSPGQPFARVTATPVSVLSRLNLVMVDVSGG